MTIDELVQLVKPDYVSVNNPKEKGVPTAGNTEVLKAEIDFDEVDGAMMYITIKD